MACYTLERSGGLVPPAQSVSVLTKAVKGIDGTALTRDTKREGRKRSAVCSCNRSAGVPRKVNAWNKRVTARVTSVLARGQGEAIRRHAYCPG